MDGISYTDGEIEQNRLEDRDRVAENRGMTIEEMEAHYMNEVGIHEPLHTSWIFHENVQGYLAEHPVVVLDPIAYKHVFDAATALFNLHQHLGRVQHEIVTDQEKQKD